eukprot:11454022-Alexandrium_andersonii.AAC.1
MAGGRRATRRPATRREEPCPRAAVVLLGALRPAPGGPAPGSAERQHLRPDAPARRARGPDRLHRVGPDDGPQRGAHDERLRPHPP